MKFVKHCLFVAILATIIFFVAQQVYGAMIENIYTNRDTGYNPAELTTAITLDRIMTIYYFPITFFSIPLIRNFAPLETLLRFPKAISICLSVFWSLLAYSLIFIVHMAKKRL